LTIVLPRIPRLLKPTKQLTYRIERFILKAKTPRPCLLLDRHSPVFMGKGEVGGSSKARVDVMLTLPPLPRRPHTFDLHNVVVA
jgi:hypothetical protein